MKNIIPLLIGVLQLSLFSCNTDSRDMVPPNVLFIAVDDLNDWTGFLKGHPDTYTPNLDRLAANGMVFTNAHCQAPICGPSRASLMTGLLPSTTGIYAQIKDTDIRTVNDAAGKSIFLAEYFGNHGYRTMGVGKLFHNGDGAGTFQEYGGEFEKFGPKPEERFKYDPAWFDKPGGTQTDWGAYPEKDEQMPDFKIARWAVERLQQRHDQPFFLAAGFIRPHVPWYVPEKWFDRTRDQSITLPPYLKDDQADVPEISRAIHEIPMMPTTEWAIDEGHYEDIVKAYLACVTFVDAQIGKVLDALEHSPYADNTVIVLWSDHGYHLGEKNRFAKHSLWQRSTHVPLIFSVPGMKKGTTCSKPVGLIDLYPTLLDLCGLPENGMNEGHSLVPLLNDPAGDWNHSAVTTYGQGNHSVYSEQYHYIRYEDGTGELYDLTSDPNEWNNLINDPAKQNIIADLEAHLPSVNEPYSPKSLSNVNEYFRSKN